MLRWLHFSDFGKTMEKKLHLVGIHSAEELTKIGSKQATFRLKELYPNTCVVILYHLEAACYSWY